MIAWSGDDLLDHIHAAWIAGWNAGLAHGRKTASEDLARQWLQEDARRWTEQASNLAGQRHGPAWAQAIREQAREVA